MKYSICEGLKQQSYSSDLESTDMPDIKSNPSSTETISIYLTAYSNNVI